MIIETPKQDEQGYEINWIIKDHVPTDGNGYDSTRCEYGTEVYSDPDEAKQELISKVKDSGVDWGYVVPVFYEFIDGLPLGWEPFDYNDKIYYEEMD